MAQHHRYDNLLYNCGEIELSDLSLSTDACARDVPQDHRSQDVRMSHVRFNDVVQSLEVRPNSEQYEKPINKSVLGKDGVYITISRRACAFTDLAKDEITKRRTTHAKSGGWQKSALRRHIVLEIANQKAQSDRSELSSVVHSRRAPLSPRVATPLLVIPTKPVTIQGGKKRREHDRENGATFVEGPFGFSQRRQRPSERSVHVAIT